MAIDRERGPNDAAREQALVAVLISELPMLDDDDRDNLLVRFECAAWPTLRAQLQ